MTLEEISRLPKTKKDLIEQRLVDEGQVLAELAALLQLKPESKETEQWFKAAAVCRLQARNFNKRNMSSMAETFTEQANDLELHGWRLLIGNKKEVIGRIRRLQIP